MTDTQNMTVKELIEALSKLKPDAPVLIDIMQYNEVHGKVQLNVISTMPRSNYQTWVGSNYQGATITVHLPGKAIISRLP